jgi:toxin ParE1/3/4
MRDMIGAPTRRGRVETRCPSPIDIVKHHVKITAPALGDIEAIAADTVAEWGDAQARRDLTQIDRTNLALVDNPALGRERHGVPSAIKGRKAGAHVIFYRVDGETLYILRILHESMDHGRHVGAET